METIYSSNYCISYFEKSTSQMKVVWTAKQLSNEIFVNHLKIFSEKALQYKPKTIFVDARDHKYTVPSDIQKWHDENVIPAYIKAGITKMVFLIPNSIFSELTTKKIFDQQKAKESLPTEFFKTENEALTWLNIK